MTIEEAVATLGRVRADDLHPNSLEARQAKGVLAAAWLAEHDATPATIEWWKSLGAHQLWADDDTLYVTKDAGYDCNEVGLGTSNCIGWEVADTFGGERSVAMIGSISGGQGPATRGEVRRLASALGIPLKESP